MKRHCEFAKKRHKFVHEGGIFKVTFEFIIASIRFRRTDLAMLCVSVCLPTFTILIQWSRLHTYVLL